MEITGDLIQKFFENKCDKEEFEVVLAYLYNNPDQREKYLGMKEWDEIDPPAFLPDGSSAEMLAQLKEQLFKKNERTVEPAFIRFTWMAVAASFIVLMIGLHLVAPKNAQNRDLATAGRKKKENDPKDTTAAAWITRTNNTGKPMPVYLPDGSLVALQKHSSIRYRDSLGTKRRAIWLDGEAFFTVAKNRNRPFTVISGSLATTALGTSFNVIAPENGTRDIRIKLYTGKVMVKATGDLPGWNKDIYLSPGLQVSYDKTRMLAATSRFRPLVPAGGTVPGNVQEPDLVFNNSSLKEVMDRLSVQYHKKIMYTGSDLSGMNFTGTVSHSDSLAVFLKLLATMNGLEIQEQEPVYIITKSRVNK